MTVTQVPTKAMLADPQLSKQDAELGFWKREIHKYRKWYRGKLEVHYRTGLPASDQKVHLASEADSAIVTWHRLHQEPKYLHDLQLPADAFEGMRLLDVGSGPMPSGTCFKRAKLYCLDPLWPQYLQAGFPIHHYGAVRFIHAPAEKIPMTDSFFDAVVSVNAIDHVDDIRAVAAEIRRVLKPDGLLRMHVHYHAVKKCEPVAISDRLFQDLFESCGPLIKIATTRRNFSTELPADEQFVVWSNF